MLPPFFLYIFSQTTPSQVIGSVVFLVAVDMVYRGLGLRVIVFTECRRHQSADKKMPALTITAKADTIISLVICKSRQESCIRVFEAFDAPHIADKVFPLVAFYWSPFLIWQIGYSIYGYHHPFYISERGTRLRVKRNRITSPWKGRLDYSFKARRASAVPSIIVWEIGKDDYPSLTKKKWVELLPS